MKIKNTSYKLLAVILLPVCVFLYFAFSNHFEGCPVPYDDTKECEVEECNELKGGKKKWLNTKM